MREEGSVGVGGVEVGLCEQVLGKVATAGGEAPVELVAVHSIQLW